MDYQQYAKAIGTSSCSIVIKDSLLDILVMLLGTLRLLGGGEMDGSFSSKGRLDEDIVVLWCCFLEAKDDVVMRMSVVNRNLQ